MYQLFKKILTFFAALAVGAAAFAQVTTSSLGGRIQDEGDEALTGAAVIAVHTPSGTRYTAIANNDGRYAIQGMRTGGPYTVEVSFIGMGTVRFEDITLKLGEPYELNVILRSSNELDAVTVVAEKSFNASITGAGSSFSLRSVETMPTIDRSVYDVVKYTPQATMNKNGGISFSGANNRYNSFQIDGAVANDTFGLSASGTNGGQTDANPVALDAIEEIQVVVAPFDVRQSGFTGGAINAITKSGTNSVKGSAYTYYTNQDMIGTTPGDEAAVINFNGNGRRTKYEEQFSETFGFTVGGPIVRNKLFLFLSGEYYKNSRPNIYTPYNGSYEKEDLKLSKTVELADGTSYDYFNAELAGKLIDYYEKNYGLAGKTGESISPHQIDIVSRNILARLDWNINETNKLMLRYQFMDAAKDRYSSGYRTYYFNNSSFLQANRTNTLVAELNSRISPVLSNMFRATAVFVRDHREIPYRGANMYIKDKVYINIGTEYSSGGNAMDSDTYTITDNLSWYLGRHELTLGTHNEFYSFNNLFLQYAFGEYEFATLADFFHNAPTAFYYRYSDPAVTGSDDTSNWRATTHAAQFGLYLQDEWKPNTNLTLTFGIRFDMPLLLNKPTENPEFNRSAISLDSGEKVGVVPKAEILRSPRVGFRWFLDDSHKSLLRGGAGLFTGRVPFVWISNAYNNTGMEAKAVRVNNPGADFPLTSTPYQDIILTGKAEAAGGQATINTLNRNFKYPQVFRVNLGYEHSFDNGWKFTFDGLWSKTLNNVFFKNLALQQTGTVYAVSASAANEYNTAPYYSTEDVPYSAVVALLNTNKGHTYSLSGKLEKHFDFGLDLMAAYTFGHAYSVNDATSSVALSNWQTNLSVDTNNPELAYSLFDKPHKLMGVASWRTHPYLRGRLRSTFTLSYQGGSGQRYSYAMNESSVDFNNDGRTGNSLMYIPTADEIGQMRWSAPGDAAAFERFIRADRYLSSHRGRWSDRYAGIAPFEHHFDFQFAQDFLYDRKNNRRVQLTCDIINAANLLNREWGLYYSSSTSLQVLTVTSATKDAKGGVTPTYHFDPQRIYLADFYSRWRLQVGARFTF